MANSSDIENLQDDLVDTIFAGDDEFEKDDDLKLEGDVPGGDTLDDDDNDEDPKGQSKSELEAELEAELMGEEEGKTPIKEKAQKPTTPVAKKPEQQQQQADQFSTKDIITPYETDAAGNITLNGKVIAKSGTERKMFERFRGEFQKQHRQTVELSQHMQKVVDAGKQLKAKYDKLIESKNYGDTIGLVDAEQRQALEIAAMSKVDPKGAAKKFLTLMQLNGIDLSELGTPDVMDPKTIAEQAVQQYIASQKQNEPEKQPASATLPVDVPDTPEAREAMSFLEKTPQARPFVQYIDDAKSRFPHLSYDQIWHNLQQGVARAKAKAAQKPEQKKPVDPASTSQTRQRKRPQKFRNSSADPNQSFKQIGRDLLKDIQARVGD